MKKKMLNKKEMIGRIQLVMGIILLVGGIVGIIICSNWFQNEINNEKILLTNNFQGIKENNYSNETKALQANNLGIAFYLQYSSAMLTLINLISAFGLMIIISILFITQGLVNLSVKEV